MLLLNLSRSYRCSRLSIFAFCALAVAHVLPGSAPDARAAEQTPFKITTSPDFANPKAALERLVAKRGRKESNTFCVIGYRFEDGSDLAWVYWPENQAMILWELTTEGVPDLALSKRYLRKNEDVVANESALGGSSYFVTQDWWNGTIADCNKFGEHFSIRKPQAK